VQLPLVQVDAFTARPLAGNPAAVMVLPRWLPDALLQGIAAENNLSETAFLVDEGEGEPGWHLRWFTPTVEVDLCGHATLASGYVLLRGGGDAVRFRTRSGVLEVRREGDALAMSLPALQPHPASPPAEVVEALGAAPIEVLAVKAVHHASYWLARYERHGDVAALAPDFARLRHARANVICTAPGDDCDFVSRFFAPGSGIDEDPVTGSAHATLAPYWSTRLGCEPAKVLRARQISARGGEVLCRLEGDRVWLVGRCAPYLEGTVTLPDGP
jgi:PhzF family phenazine biosynthesis protein